MRLTDAEYRRMTNAELDRLEVEPFIALLTFIGAEFETFNTGGWNMVTYWQATDSQYIGIGAGCIVAYDGDYRTPCTDSLECACRACSGQEGTVIAEYQS